MGLDMAGGRLEADRALVQRAVDMDVSKFPVLEAGFMVSRVIMGEGSVMVATSPPDFSVNEGGFFFFGQGR